MTKFEKIARLVAGLSVKDLEPFTAVQAEAFRVVHAACSGHRHEVHGLDSEEIALLKAGRWTESIKHLHNRSPGLGLADARDRVYAARAAMGL